MCGGGGGSDPKEQESKLALAKQAANSLKRYGEIFIPLENAFIQDNLDAFGDRAYESGMGQTNSAVSAMYEEKMPEYQAEIFQGGIDPTAGAYHGKIDSINSAKARSMGQAGANASISQTDNAYGGLQNIVAAGQGLQTEAMQGNVGRMNDQFSLASKQAESDFQKRSSASEIAGTVAGAAGGMYANSSRNG
mgnify:FL=1|tara:strand:- start:558 stop:1133 length:576 start_codon:yes stop_codon:yes gene_type:complete